MTLGVARKFTACSLNIFSCPDLLQVGRKHFLSSNTASTMSNLEQEILELGRNLDKFKGLNGHHEVEGLELVDVWTCVHVGLVICLTEAPLL